MSDAAPSSSTTRMTGTSSPGGVESTPVPYVVSERRDRDAARVTRDVTSTAAGPTLVRGRRGGRGRLRVRRTSCRWSGAWHRRRATARPDVRGGPGRRGPIGRGPPCRWRRDRARPSRRRRRITPSAASRSGPGRTIGNHPSARRPMRRYAGSELPPIQTGIGRWIGRGARPAAVTRSNVPSNVRDGSVHSARTSSICSPSRRPRWSNGCPSASYSTAFHPMPTPKRKRPPVRRSTSAACFADEHRLTLREDDDAGDELQVGDAGQVAEHDEWFVERGTHVVRAVPRRVRGGVRADHVVVGQQMVVAELVDGQPVGAYRIDVAAELGLGEHDADLHDDLPAAAFRRIRAVSSGAISIMSWPHAMSTTSTPSASIRRHEPSRLRSGGSVCRT